MGTGAELFPIDGRDNEVRYRRIVVRKDPVTELVNGVVQPEQFQRAHHGTSEPALTGVVVYSRTDDLPPGTRVMFGKYSGSDVEHEGQTLTIMPERDLLAVLES